MGVCCCCIQELGRPPNGGREYSFFCRIPCTADADTWPRPVISRRSAVEARKKCRNASAVAGERALRAYGNKGYVVLADYDSSQIYFPSMRLQDEDLRIPSHCSIVVLVRSLAGQDLRQRSRARDDPTVRFENEKSMRLVEHSERVAEPRGTKTWKESLSWKQGSLHVYSDNLVEISVDFFAQF